VVIGQKQERRRGSRKPSNKRYAFGSLKGDPLDTVLKVCSLNFKEIDHAY
jgi:hypothetical protein